MKKSIQKKNLENVLLADLENAFDGVSREVFCFTLRWDGVPEYLINVVLSLYKDCKTAVSVDGKLANSFAMKVGVHQGSPLSILLFITVTDILTENVSRGSLMELLYADDLLLCGETLNEVMGKYGRLENVVEGKCLRVNVDKTRGMQLLFRKKSSISKGDACGVCGERVGCNSLQCTNDVD